MDEALHRSSPTLGGNVIELQPTKAHLSATEFNRLPREGKTWLFAAIVMFVTGMFKGINLLILLAYLLIGLWIVNWRIEKIDLRQVRGRRLPHEPIIAGEVAEFQIELTAAGNRPVLGLTIADRGSNHEQRWIVLRMANGKPVRIRYRFVFAKRGRTSVEPLRAIARFPFGLVVRTAELAPAEEWIVLPRLGTVFGERLKHWLAKSTRGDGRMRRRRLQPALQEADIHGLREFRPGDSPRWIHWRSSARRNQILVREFEDSSPPHLILIVEPWLPSAANAKDRNRFEALLSLAASVCKEWSRDSAARLTLVIPCSETVILPAGSGSEFALRTMEALAIAEGDPSAIAMETWIDRLPHCSSSVPVLVLSNRPSTAQADEIAGHFGRPVARAGPYEELDWYEPPVSGTLV